MCDSSHSSSGIKKNICLSPFATMQSFSKISALGANRKGAWRRPFINCSAAARLARLQKHVYRIPAKENKLRLNVSSQMWQRDGQLTEMGEDARISQRSWQLK